VVRPIMRHPVGALVWLRKQQARTWCLAGVAVPA
jgi:hypothetical protein